MKQLTLFATRFNIARLIIRRMEGRSPHISMAMKSYCPSGATRSLAIPRRALYLPTFVEDMSLQI